MENRKYIVRNCPCYSKQAKYYDCWDNPLSWCQNIDDCLIKKTIGLVEKEALIGGINDTAEKVLDLFIIEGINE